MLVRIMHVHIVGIKVLFDVVIVGTLPVMTAASFLNAITAITQERSLGGLPRSIQNRYCGIQKSENGFYL